MTLKKMQEELQASLILGWKNFDGSRYQEALNWVLQALIKAGFYQSEASKYVPITAYQYAAELVGRKFVEKARELDIRFDEIFPGKYEKSSEVKEDGYEVRTFKLSGYRKEGKFYAILTFPHLHERVKFTQPPTLRLVKA